MITIKCVLNSHLTPPPPHPPLPSNPTGSGLINGSTGEGYDEPGQSGRKFQKKKGRQNSKEHARAKTETSVPLLKNNKGDCRVPQTHFWILEWTLDRQLRFWKWWTSWLGKTPTQMQHAPSSESGKRIDDYVAREIPLHKNLKSAYLLIWVNAKMSRGKDLRPAMNLHKCYKRMMQSC